MVVRAAAAHRGNWQQPKILLREIATNFTLLRRHVTNKVCGASSASSRKKCRFQNISLDLGVDMFGNAIVARDRAALYFELMIALDHFLRWSQTLPDAAAGSFGEKCSACSSVVHGVQFQKRCQSMTSLITIATADCFQYCSVDVTDPCWVLLMAVQWFFHLFLFILLC